MSRVSFIGGTLDPDYHWGASQETFPPLLLIIIRTYVNNSFNKSPIISGEALPCG
jgi:hypothetical protein